MNSIVKIINDLLSAWKDGSKRVRVVIILAILMTDIALIISIFGKDSSSISYKIAGSLGVVAATLVLSVIGYQKYKIDTTQELKIEEFEKRVEKNPRETKAAWELARVKLESYLNRNLRQIKYIFWLTVFVMMVGFSLIGFGIYKAFNMPTADYYPSLVAAVSGILVNFIGATFLVLYKSTMTQATEYVNILERNRVGGEPLGSRPP